MYTLHIGNKNYSSWSLRSWAVMKACGIPFKEELHRFDFASGNGAFRSFSPSSKVPCLVDGAQVVWDSLAIIEYLAERHTNVWPSGASARAWARSASAEMHSGFTQLRGHHGMNIGVRVAVTQRPAGVLADITRIEEIWNEGLRRFGGPFLAGDQFTAVDAFYLPVVFRFQTYGVTLGGAAANYMNHMLVQRAAKEWETAALAENFRDDAHDEELKQAGTVTADLRTPTP
ncbi:MAG: glutathione S-transferase family protein [Rhodocyclaceae bacterium]|nr:glutathione S-transferase family protein [Rhodocyclaceae bacterium]